MSSWRTACCGLLWTLTCLPGYLRFLRATRDLKRCQALKLRRLLKANGGTGYGQAHRFERIQGWPEVGALPLTGYDDYRSAVRRIMDGGQDVLTRDAVRILQPTSGTSSAPRLVPFTQSLAREFTCALDAWLADLFRQRPRLAVGSQYWSISPSTVMPDMPDSRVPIGFLDDAEYFGRRRRWIVDRVMAVPAIAARIPDVEASRYVTALFLVRARDLRLISVWHPSFLTVLLDSVRSAWPRLLRDIEQGGISSEIDLPAGVRGELERQLPAAGGRARALAALDPQSADLYAAVWPGLQIISCWRDGSVQGELTQLEDAFPGVLVQGKGLLATEGVVSIPIGPSQQHVCAVTSHVLEFLDDNDVLHPAWAVEEGVHYRVVLSTAGGLYRYQLNDRVEVTGLFGQAPCLRFLGRAGVVSDCVGEKLHLEQVEAIMRDLCAGPLGTPLFAMLVPSTGEGGRRYNLLVEPDADGGVDAAAVAEALDLALRANYHYAHAREIGQLLPVVVTPLAPGARERYRACMVGRGAVAGTVKFPALCTVPGVEACLAGTTGKKGG